MEKKLSPYFSDTYQEAFNKFKEAAVEALNIYWRADKDGADYHEFTNLTAPPSLEGEALCSALLWLGPREAKAVRLMRSGWHGAEGFAGAAIQLKAIEEAASQPQPEGLASVFHFAANPYGMDRMRRGNEHNIDLNRNVIDWDKIKPQDHRLAAAVHDILVPEQWNLLRTTAQLASLIKEEGLKKLEEAENRPEGRLETFKFIAKSGFGELFQAVQQGQYSFPNGLFYGGSGPTWSANLAKHIAKECTREADFLIDVDIHTGLGKRGAYEMIVAEAESSPVTQRARDIWGDAVKSTKSGASVSKHVSGSIDYIYTDEMKDRCDITFSAAEFGTQPVPLVLRALAYDNWVHATMQDETHRERARHLMRQAFSPRDPAWEQKVLDGGMDIWRKAGTSLEKRLLKIS